MAEKTQNKDIIYVFSQEFICNNCKDWYEHIDPLDKPNCDNCEDIDYLPHISRQEAINRMAKALVEYEKTNNPNACEWSDLKERAKDTYRERAESALNALLENE